MVFSAMYLDHHWLLDAALGALYAVIAFCVMRLPRWLAHGRRSGSEVTA